VEQWYSLKSQIGGIFEVRLTILYLEEARYKLLRFFFTQISFDSPKEISTVIFF